MQQIPGFENIFATQDGRIFRGDRELKPYHSASQPDKEGLTEKRYPRICINRKQYYVHRLMAMAFLGLDPTSKLEVDHINADKTDNRLENLRLCTHAENIQFYVLSRASA